MQKIQSVIPDKIRLTTILVTPFISRADNNELLAKTQVYYPAVFFLLFDGMLGYSLRI